MIVLDPQVDPYPGLVHPVECGCEPCWTGVSVKAGHGLRAGAPVPAIAPIRDGQVVTAVVR